LSFPFKLSLSAKTYQPAIALALVFFRAKVVIVKREWQKKILAGKGTGRTRFNLI